MKVKNYIVSALKDEGWRDVSIPVEREESATLVQAHWRLGRLARRRIAVAKKPGRPNKSVST
ncbi:MAG: hypothetical protein KDK08_05295 [Rhizobiaceae bacterium]|nr:hypothetical protein [Rhizobiaceae bacterium]MCC0000885.1 hypothetical protein [Methylobacteriaceae bacterium]